MATEPRRGRACLTRGLLGCLLLVAGAARAEQPLSAIDWLSQSVAAPVSAPGPIPSSVPMPPPDPDQPAVASSARPGSVTVTVLGATAPDGLGLLPPAQTGLPAALWGLSRTEDLARAISAERPVLLPALHGLFLTLLLAETDPPVDSGGGSLLFLARIDKLLDMGALDQAAALTALNPVLTPDLFRRSFDIALLTGQEDAACDAMQSAAHLAPTLAARIFCLARAGDWNAAALTLDTSRALGQVAGAEDQLLSRFLDAELAEDSAPLPPPDRPTPLVWRMYEAIGEPLNTQHLPLAFAHAELRPQAGWKAQIEAAERLARAGAVTPNLLLGLYTERDAAASGGVWDRVDLFQRFDSAMQRGDLQAIAAALPPVWQAMAAAELESVFAELYGEKLARLDLPAPVDGLALRIGLLSPAFETVARLRLARGPGADLQEGFLLGLATGQIAGLAPPDSMARGIAPAFLAPALAPEAETMLQERRPGEALLLALDAVDRGVRGDPRGVAEGLSLLRRLGLEGVARRTALELLLLERRG